MQSVFWLPQRVDGASLVANLISSRDAPDKPKNEESVIKFGLSDSNSSKGGVETSWSETVPPMASATSHLATARTEGTLCVCRGRVVCVRATVCPKCREDLALVCPSN